jgi:hypothetical protein
MGRKSQRTAIGAQIVSDNDISDKFGQAGPYFSNDRQSFFWEDIVSVNPQVSFPNFPVTEIAIRQGFLSADEKDFQ